MKDGTDKVAAAERPEKLTPANIAAHCIAGILISRRELPLPDNEVARAREQARRDDMLNFFSSGAMMPRTEEMVHYAAVRRANVDTIITRGYRLEYDQRGKKETFLDWAQAIAIFATPLLDWFTEVNAALLRADLSPPPLAPPRDFSANMAGDPAKGIFEEAGKEGEISDWAKPPEPVPPGTMMITENYGAYHAQTGSPGAEAGQADAGEDGEDGGEGDGAAEGTGDVSGESGGDVSGDQRDAVAADGEGQGADENAGPDGGGEDAAGQGAIDAREQWRRKVEAQVRAEWQDLDVTDAAIAQEVDARTAKAEADYEASR